MSTVVHLLPLRCYNFSTTIHEHSDAAVSTRHEFNNSLSLETWASLYIAAWKMLARNVSSFKSKSQEQYNPSRL